jgi:hypothetical protein
MNLTDILNIVVTILAVITIILSWFIWRIVKTKSILCIFMAMCFGFVIRILVYFDTDALTRAIIAIFFWSLWTMGLWYLLKLLKKYTNRSNGGTWNSIKKWMGLK